MNENDQPQMYKKRYKIVNKLGAGNFGIAYLVTDLQAPYEPYVNNCFFHMNIHDKYLY